MKPYPAFELNHLQRPFFRLIPVFGVGRDEALHDDDEGVEAAAAVKQFDVANIEDDEPEVDATTDADNVGLRPTEVEEAEADVVLEVDSEEDIASNSMCFSARDKLCKS